MQSAHLKVEGATPLNALGGRHEMRLQLRELRHGALLGALLVNVPLQRRQQCGRGRGTARTLAAATASRCMRRRCDE